MENNKRSFLWAFVENWLLKMVKDAGFNLVTTGQTSG